MCEKKAFSPVDSDEKDFLVFDDVSDCFWLVWSALYSAVALARSANSHALSALERFNCSVSLAAWRAIYSTLRGRGPDSATVVPCFLCVALVVVAGGKTFAPVIWVW